MALRYEHVSSLRYLLFGGPRSRGPRSSTVLGAQAHVLSSGMAMRDIRLSQQHGVGAGRHQGRIAESGQAAASQDLRADSGRGFQGAVQTRFAGRGWACPRGGGVAFEGQSDHGGPCPDVSIRQNDSRSTRPVKWTVRPLGNFPSRGNRSQNLEA